jgi:uncharacterized circularly permuted ATP-grasp superfamily protein
LQRGKAINAWLQAVYGPGQHLVPEEIVRGSVFYWPHELPGGTPPVHVYGPDVVHLASGEYVVLEDNVRVPSGVAYSEAIRRAGMEAMPELYGAYRVMEIYSYYDRLRETLELASPEGVEEPYVAVVTRGAADPAFFEHRRIAEACGIAILTLAECLVSEGFLYAREDGRRIDVIYRRFDEDYVDTDLPGLRRAYLEGNVSFVNAPGVGVADDKAIFPYVSARSNTTWERLRSFLTRLPTRSRRRRPAPRSSSGCPRWSSNPAKATGPRDSSSGRCRPRPMSTPPAGIYARTRHNSSSRRRWTSRPMCSRTVQATETMRCSWI